jgi:hypothetical protein
VAAAAALTKRRERLQACPLARHPRPKAAPPLRPFLHSAPPTRAHWQARAGPPALFEALCYNWARGERPWGHSRRPAGVGGGGGAPQSAPRKGRGGRAPRARMGWQTPDAARAVMAGIVLVPGRVGLYVSQGCVWAWAGLHARRRNGFRHPAKRFGRPADPRRGAAPRAAGRRGSASLRAARAPITNGASRRRKMGAGARGCRGRSGGEPPPQNPRPCNGGKCGSFGRTGLVTRAQGGARQVAGAEGMRGEGVFAGRRRGARRARLFACL